VWLDGDAMVHCVVTNNGRLAYASHWVVSGLQQHREERAAEAKQQQESAVAAAGKAEPVRSEPVPPSVFLTLSDLVSSPLDPAIVVPVREGAAPFIRPPQPAAAASAAAAAKPPSSLPPAAGASAPSEPVERTARWYRLMTYKLRQWCGDLPASAAHRFGTPNVGVVAHGKRLLAYGHSDVPYALSVSKEGEVSTLGPFNYYGALAHPFSAARVDEESGDMFVLGVQYEARPYLSLSVVNKAGVLTHSAPIYTSRASVTCDLAFTESMAVVWEQPFAFEGASLSALSRNPFRFDARRKLRIGVFPRASRNPDAQIRWFEAAPGFIFHAANAWDEKDSVVLVACRMGAMAWEWLCGIGDAESKEPFDWRHKPVLVRYDLSLSTGQLRETVLLDVAAELPTVNPAMQGRASRFVYLAHMSPDQFPLFDGLLKFDLGERQVVGNVTYDPDVYGGECRFVARDSANPTGEDDGYLVTFLSDVSAATTQFIVFDAKRLSADYKPIAVVDIATRVPFGLGGCFVPESVLRQVQQRAAGVARKEDDTAAREEQARALVVIRRAAAAAAQPAPSPSSAAAAPPSRASPANPSSGSSGPAAPSSTSARGERSGSIAASSGGPASRRRSSVTAAK
jgi:carotenoid cleavage dioxygenase